MQERWNECVLHYCRFPTEARCNVTEEGWELLLFFYGIKFHRNENCCWKIDRPPRWCSRALSIAVYTDWVKVHFFFFFRIFSPLPSPRKRRFATTPRSCTETTRLACLLIHGTSAAVISWISEKRTRFLHLDYTATFSVAVELRPEFFKRPPSRNGNLAFFTTWTCATIVQRLILISRLIRNCNTCVVLWTWIIWVLSFPIKFSINLYFLFKACRRGSDDKGLLVLFL